MPLTTTKAGSAHAIVGWFDLQLDDAVWLSSRPGTDLQASSNSPTARDGPVQDAALCPMAWGQAVYFLDEAIVLHAGARVTIQADVSETLIDLRLG